MNIIVRHWCKKCVQDFATYSWHQDLRTWLLKDIITHSWFDSKDTLVCQWIWFKRHISLEMDVRYVMIQFPSFHFYVYSKLITYTCTRSLRLNKLMDHTYYFSVNLNVECKCTSGIDCVLHWFFHLSNITVWPI